MHKAFFLDRDGTINVDYNFVHKPGEWTWCERATDALRWMKEQNYKIIIVTNQSGIARGRYSEEDVRHLHNWVDVELNKMDLHVHEWYYAAHHPEYDLEERFPVRDRKPAPGMFEKAAAKYNIDFSRSYMAGDKITDLKPAVELGITPFFIRSRHEPQQDKDWLQRYSIPVFDTLYDSVEFLKENGVEGMARR